MRLLCGGTNQPLRPRRRGHLRTAKPLHRGGLYSFDLMEQCVDYESSVFEFIGAGGQGHNAAVGAELHIPIEVGTGLDALQPFQILVVPIEHRVPRGIGGVGNVCGEDLGLVLGVGGNDEHIRVAVEKLTVGVIADVGEHGAVVHAVTVQNGVAVGEGPAVAAVGEDAARPVGLAVVQVGQVIVIVAAQHHGVVDVGILQINPCHHIVIDCGKAREVHFRPDRVVGDGCGFGGQGRRGGGRYGVLAQIVVGAFSLMVFKINAEQLPCGKQNDAQKGKGKQHQRQFFLVHKHTSLGVCGIPIISRYLQKASFALLPPVRIKMLAIYIYIYNVS